VQNYATIYMFMHWLCITNFYINVFACVVIDFHEVSFVMLLIMASCELCVD
jgi:hypothetical protein